MDEKWKYYQDQEESLDLLSSYLADGKLGLMIGAGTSMSFGLPGWGELVKRICDNNHIEFTGDLERDIDKFKNSKIASEYINTVNLELYKKYKYAYKDIKDDLFIEEVSPELRDVNKEYLIANNELYKREKVIDMFCRREEILEDVELDFKTANKDLLIAMSSLIIGKKKGRINKVLSLNYDSILEWYLSINGLYVSTNFRNEGSIIESNDVEIIYPLGYLPHKVLMESLNKTPSEKIVFSWEEMEQFKQDHSSNLKELLYSFLRSKVFLAIGISPRTLRDYIGSFIVHLNNDYNQSLYGRHPQLYGIALASQKSIDSFNKEFNDDIINTLHNKGIILVEIEHKEIPEFLFKIARKTVGIRF